MNTMGKVGKMKKSLFVLTAGCAGLLTTACHTHTTVPVNEYTAHYGFTYDPILPNSRVALSPALESETVLPRTTPLSGTAEVVQLGTNVVVYVTNSTSALPGSVTVMKDPKPVEIQPDTVPLSEVRSTESKGSVVIDNRALTVPEPTASVFVTNNVITNQGYIDREARVANEPAGAATGVTAAPAPIPQVGVATENSAAVGTGAAAAPGASSGTASSSEQSANVQSVINEPAGSQSGGITNNNNIQINQTNSLNNTSSFNNSGNVSGGSATSSGNSLNNQSQSQSGASASGTATQSTPASTGSTQGTTAGAAGSTGSAAGSAGAASGASGSAGATTPFRDSASGAAATSQSGSAAGSSATSSTATKDPNQQ
jgi:hypothetical protein